jgi:Domain of unknown function (DUF4424)
MVYRDSVLRNPLTANSAHDARSAQRILAYATLWRCKIHLTLYRTQIRRAMRYSGWHKTIVAAVVALTACYSLARAQESSTELVHRGLSLPNWTDVTPLTLETEQVTINPETIQIKYRISNVGTRPVAMVFTLPLPDLDFSDPDVNWSIPASDSVNFVGLSATVNRKPATFYFSQEAFSNGKDVSAVLRQHRLALIPVGMFRDQLAALPPDRRARLATAGIIMQSGTDQTGDPLYFPVWSVKTTASLRLAFAPGETIEVELRNRTSVGVSRDSVLREPLRSVKELAPEVNRRRAEYCIDKAFYAGVDKIVASFLADKEKPLVNAAPPQDALGRDLAESQSAKNVVPPIDFSRDDADLKPQAPTLRVFPVANAANIREWRIVYDLTAGAPSAAIKDFRLVVDKGKPDRVVSFCLDNLKRISPTAFEMRAANFTPNGTLKVLLVGRE